MVGGAWMSGEKGALPVLLNPSSKFAWPLSFGGQKVCSLTAGRTPSAARIWPGGAFSRVVGGAVVRAVI